MIRATTILALLLYASVSLGGLIGCGDDEGACWEGITCRDTTQEDCKGAWDPDNDCPES